MKSRIAGKKRWRALVVALCTLALAVTPMFAAWGADASSGEMSASKQTFANGKQHAEAGGRTESFVLDGEYFYQSLGGDTGKSTLTLSSSTLQNIVKDKLLPQWSPVAASVFRDQAGQLVDLYGYENNGGNMSQAGFDAYFNMSASGNTKYSDETWSCYSLRDKLKQTWASHAGDPGWDQLTVTGVKRVNSLNEARDLVGQALYDCENHKGLEAHEFLDVDEGGGSTRLEGLDDEGSTTAFVNIVTSVNCKGASADFDYVSFGIVFYDFEPVPVAAHGLQYNMGNVDVNPADKGENSSVISNSQTQDIVHSAKLGDAVTETTSTTLSGLASFNLKQNIGANIGWSETESSSYTNFSADEESGDIGAETSGSSSTQSFGLNWGAAWEMGGALGAEQGHSKSQEVSKAVETTIALPPHTASGIDQKTTSTTYSQNYQQPAILSYKVAIFAVSGDFYSGGSGGINPGSYDKQSLVIKFDTKSDSRPSYGCAATDDLYSRTVANRSASDYDVAAGRTYTTHSNARGWNKSTDINWDNVISTAKNHYGVEIIGNVNANGDFAKKGVARFNYFYETPGKLDVVQDKTTSKATPLYPLYDLAYVTAPTSKYTVTNSGDVRNYDLGALALAGYNRYKVPFYGFDSSWGQWELCNKAGEAVTSDAYNGVTLNNNKITIANGSTTTEFYLTWKPIDLALDKRPKTGDSLEGQNLFTSGINTPVVTVEVLNSALDNPQVTAEGSYTGFYGTSINLNKVLKCEVYDASGKIIDTPVMWESREPSSRGNIIVDEATGKVVFKNPGTYEVRPYVMANPQLDASNNEVYGSWKAYPVNANGDSEWLTVVATEHDLTYYEKKDPTDCVGGDAFGWIGHYRCSDCGNYFLDAAGMLKVPADKVIIEATGHKWGEWKTVNEPEGDTPGVQQRVCQNRANHVETRTLYLVQFDPNGGIMKDDKGKELKDVSQIVFTGGSVAAPIEPTQKGYTFEGWYADGEETPYDFSTTVTGNLTLKAKWAPLKYTVVTSGVTVVTGIDGEQKISPAATCKIGISAAGSSMSTPTKPDDDGYTYCYMEVATGDTVTLTVAPGANYKFDTNANTGNTIQAALLNTSNWSTGEPVTLVPDGTDPNVYSLIMPAADVAVAASFSQEQVTITYNENLPEDMPNSGTEIHKEGSFLDGTTSVSLADFLGGTNNKTKVINTSGDGSSFTPLKAEESTPKLWWYKTTGTGSTDTELVQYTFGGWYMDSECTKPFLTNSQSNTVTRDMTLYAKWNKVVPDGTAARTVTYTLLYDPVVYPSSPSDSLSYQAEVGSAVYDPTDDLYALVGDETLKAYELETDKNGSCWFEAAEQSYASFNKANPYDFNKPIVAGDTEIHLYAKVVDRTYTVTYFDGEKQLGAQDVAYNKTINKVASDVDTTKQGCAFSAWVTSDEKEWSIEKDPVIRNQALYATYVIDVTFDANGHGDNTVVKVNSGEKVEKPADPKVEGYEFGGWYTDQACTEAYKFDALVTDSFTLYAKWTAEKRTVTFDANGHGTAPSTQIVDYGTKVPKPADLTAAGYEFGGWFTDQPCTKEYDFGAAVTNNLRLYAKWTAEPQPEPQPQPDPDHRTKLAPATWDRLWGETALDTMSFIVEAGSFGSGGTVVLATFDGYWDALTAAGIAGKLNAPVLMTPSGELAAQTRTELAALKPSRIVVCGGTAALPDSVANEAAAISGAQVVRCAGQTAVNTAESIAAEAQRLSEQAWGDTAFLCTNDGYWDALAAAPISYAKNMPIFLVNGHDTVEGSTLDAMRAAGVTKVCLVGGEAAISPAAEQAVRDAGFEVATRLGGATAIETSEKVASYGLSLGMTADYMGVATVNGYWDALAGAPLCGKKNSVLVLVAGSDSHSISGFIKDHDLTIVSGYVFGGRAAIDEATNDAILAATATVPGSDLVAASVAGL